MPFEHTVRSAVSCQGVGLHSGAPVKMRILPAPAGTGIVFRRVDLDSFEVEAVGKNVARVSYATSLQKQGVLISTTEHLLSACIGIGLDNAVIELDNLEVPILDGSAKPFVDLILQAGLRQQRRKRTYLRILREVEVREGNKFIAAYPATGYAVQYNINFAQPIGEQSFEVDLSRDLYRQEIAAARTFGFLREEKVMRNMGLICGATEENVIVVTDTGVKNGPLRFSDE
ncbi:MAG TPA: UDP-3-O-acyl-N-acetylglucosamine deacetylase, partial [Candidatus Acidoferrales bacterium]|nr:UDP-3-O-acyl-N-acetylglucosamine deacetylase [Candidatus Acidoferrales bacterium]